MQKTSSEQTPMPPSPQQTLFLPLPFWLELISNLDKRVEILCSESGYGIVAMDIKLQNGKVFEVGIEEKTRVRSVVEKAGDLAKKLPNDQR